MCVYLYVHPCIHGKIEQKSRFWHHLWFMSQLFSVVSLCFSLWAFVEKYSASCLSLWDFNCNPWILNFSSETLVLELMSLQISMTVTKSWKSYRFALFFFFFKTKDLKARKEKKMLLSVLTNMRKKLQSGIQVEATPSVASPCTFKRALSCS